MATKTGREALSSSGGRWTKPTCVAAAVLFLTVVATIVWKTVPHEPRHGILVVQIMDDGITAEVAGESLVIQDKETGAQYTVTPGDNRLPEGSYLVKVEDGRSLVVDTKAFVLTRGGRKIVTVVFLSSSSNPSLTEAEAASEVLAFGGTVKLKSLTKGGDMQFYEASSPAQLPHDREFWIYHIELHNPSVSDSDIQRILRGRTRLSALKVSGKGISDASLPVVATLFGLSTLELQQTSISNHGLIYLKHYQDMRYLGLDHCAITDNAIGHLSDMDNLQTLSVRWTDISPKGVQRLQSLLPNVKIQSSYSFK
jgi:hypothetical protein